MRTAPLTAAELFDAAAICRGRPAAETALYLAAVTHPDLPLTACAELSVGARDAGLVSLRAATFGERLDLGATCPACAARLDVALATGDLAVPEPDAEEPVLLLDGRAFRLRAADSRDLAMLATIADPEAGRVVLAGQCLEPLDDGPLPALDAATLDGIAEGLARLDPGADPFVPLACARCGHAWDAPVDIAAILSGEIAAAAEGLIDEVHDLASAYHWSEAAILALPAERRRAYLDRLSDGSTR